MREEDKLVRRMAAGDEAAAEALVARYYAEILRYCRWHAPTAALAEDATQETFLRFIRYAGRYEGRGKLRAQRHADAGLRTGGQRKPLQLRDDHQQRRDIVSENRASGYPSAAHAGGLRYLFRRCWQQMYDPDGFVAFGYWGCQGYQPADFFGRGENLR